jgi:TctA family transporter
MVKNILVFLLVIIVIAAVFGDLSFSINMFNLGQSMSIVSSPDSSWTATQTSTGDGITTKAFGVFIGLVVLAVWFKLSSMSKNKRNKWDEYDE